MNMVTSNKIEVGVPKIEYRDRFSLHPRFALLITHFVVRMP
jgi:hypothetical protein